MFNFYGFFIALGILASALICHKIKAREEKTAKPNWLKKIDIYQLLTYILIPAVIGARLYHNWDYWDYYKENLGEIMKIWQGGLGIFGAILGGIIGLWLYSKSKRLKLKEFKALLDLAGVGLALGQAIGRWGNFFNQELYGLPTNLPWAIYIKPENRLAGLESFSHFHPLFLYESLACFLIFILLWQLKQKKWPAGTIFFLYLFFYSFLRFILEFLRPAGWQIQICSLKYIRVSHIITALAMVISTLALKQIFVTIKKEQK